MLNPRASCVPGLVAFPALSTLLVTPVPLTPDRIGDHHVPSDKCVRTVVIDAGRTLLTPEFWSGEKEHLPRGILSIQLEGSFMGITCKCWALSAFALLLMMVDQ